MAKNQPHAPLVTSVSTSLKKMKPNPGTQVATKEEIKAKKQDLLGVIEKSLDIFKKNLEDGKVTMDTSLDLERLTKLTLLLSGEPDSVRGNVGETSETTTTVDSLDMSISKIEEILDLNDPEVKAIYTKISQGYNELNDIDE